MNRTLPLPSILTNETFLYIVKRLLQGLLSLFLASILCFSIIQLAPGNYLDVIKEQNTQISPETLESFRVQFGLDKSPTEQYLYWLWGVVTRFDFGQSFVYFRPVSELIVERLRGTLLLAVASIFFTWAIAIPLGFIAQITSPLLPVGGMTSINHDQLSPLGKILDLAWHMFLPTVALSLSSFAGLQRLTRGQLLDVLRQDYIQTARAKGLPENRVLYVHALRNGINPLITLLGFEFASLLSGSYYW